MGFLSVYARYAVAFALALLVASVLQAASSALSGGHQTVAQKKRRYRTKKIMSVEVDPLLRADRLPAERARDDRRRARLADAEVAAPKRHGPRVLEAHDALRPGVLGRRAPRALDRAPP